MNKTLTTWLASLADTATPCFQECCEYLGAELTWLHRLAATLQDPQWHGEGNVSIHTDWVLAELYTLLAGEAAHIQGQPRQALILGTLLHDIGKPQRTGKADINGVERIVSPQHEAVGRSYLATRLMGLGLPFAVVWQVLNLVGEHHMPKSLVVKDRPAADFWRVSRQVNLELLYWLEVADMRGRICSDLDMQLLYLEEFRALSARYGVWQQALEVKTTLAAHLQPLPAHVQAYVYAYALYQLEQGQITQAEEALATTYAHRQQHAHLVILCGPSGSGKTTWLQQHFPDYVLISLDALREQFNKARANQDNSGQIRQYAKEQLKAALRQKQGVVWDATNLRTDFRQPLTDLGRDYHALVTLVAFLLPEKQLRQQNRQREHSVAEVVLDRQLESWQFPLPNEAHQYWLVGAHGHTLYRSGFYAND